MSHHARSEFTVVEVNPLLTMNPLKLSASQPMLAIVIQRCHRPEKVIMKLSK
jgi:hypothetical protein